MGAPETRTLHHLLVHEHIEPHRARETLQRGDQEHQRSNKQT